MAAILAGLDLPGWGGWLAFALAAWLLISVPVAFLAVRLIALRRPPRAGPEAKPRSQPRLHALPGPKRVLRVYRRGRTS